MGTGMTFLLGDFYLYGTPQKTLFAISHWAWGVRSLWRALETAHAAHEQSRDSRRSCDLVAQVLEKPQCFDVKTPFEEQFFQRQNLRDDGTSLSHAWTYTLMLNSVEQIHRT